MKLKCNSWLFVPAIEKFLAKIETCRADVVIIDLEDAILNTEKDSALLLVSKFLKSYSFKTDVLVRINSDRLTKEIAELNKYAIKGYMLPKTECDEDIKKLSSITDKSIIALVETAKGIVNLSEIAKNEKVFAIAFGAEDYTTQNGIKKSDEFLLYPKSKIVAYAKAYNKIAIDTISLNITDKDKYAVEAQKTKDFGFDGKLAIHPMQVEVINSIYTDNIEYYRYIIEQYEKSGVAVLNIDGKVFEKPHINEMKRKISDFENGQN